MITVVAKNYIQKDKLEQVIRVCQELVDLTRNEDGCIKYDVYQDVNDEAILTMIEEWENQECLDAHMKSEHFTRLVPILSDLSEKTGELNVYSKRI
jgi:quinol monooxygenase YgiN